MEFANGELTTRTLRNGRPRLSREAALARVITRLEIHEGAPVELAELYEVAGVSPRTLRTMFMDVFGITPTRYLRVRRLHKAFLRYHDANNWPLLREALRRMGRADLIGNGRQHLVPAYQPIGTGRAHEGRRKRHATPFRTQHTGLPDARRPARRGSDTDRGRK